MVLSSHRKVAGAAAAALCALAAVAPGTALSARVRFSDDFEKGLSRWDLYGDRGAFVQDSGDPKHRKVLVLRPNGDVLALIRGSERWGPLAIEGEFLFPDAENNYLGVAYNARRTGDRMDFGLIYIRGNGSYLMPSPQRDFNTGRLLYEEYRTLLDGDAAVRIGEWQRFRVEVAGNTAHFYLGAAETPQLTFPLFEFDSGAVGLQPRSVGGDVWVDNVQVSSIDRLAYAGPPRPFEFQYDPEALLTVWEVAGPMPRTDDSIARDPGAHPDAWRAFGTDERGAVVTARVVDYHGPNAVAYFRTEVVTDEGGPAVLNISTIDDLALWVNGRYHWFVPRADHAWYDFWRNPEHEGQHIPVQLASGRNDIVVRVRGGSYASGGFYAWIERKR
jgi:hypothetical protein